MPSMTGERLRILALETSGRFGSAAVGTETGVLAARCLDDAMSHATALMPAVQELLSTAGWPADTLTDVFVSIGPGSFTGLRIGVSIARTLAWSVGARIVAVPTMEVLARNALRAETPPEHIAPIVDAKQAKVFTAAYRLEHREYVCLRDACLAEPGAFLAGLPRPLAVLGEGVPRHRAAVEAAGATVLPEDLWPGRAEEVLAVGLRMARARQFTAARDLVPRYVRRPEMEERWEKRHAAGAMPGGAPPAANEPAP